MYIHIYTCTHTHKHTHTQLYTYTYVCTAVHKHMCICTHIQTHKNTHIHVPIQDTTRSHVRHDSSICDMSQPRRRDSKYTVKTEQAGKNLESAVMPSAQRLFRASVKCCSAAACGSASASAPAPVVYDTYEFNPYVYICIAYSKCMYTCVYHIRVQIRLYLHYRKSRTAAAENKNVAMMCKYLYFTHQRNCAWIQVYIYISRETVCERDILKCKEKERERYLLLI